MVDAERLVIRLEAQSNRLQQQLTASNRLIDKFANAAEKRFRDMNRGVSLSLGRLGPIVAGAFSASAVQGFLDAATRIENRLASAGLAGAELDSVMSKLFATANRNAAPVEALAELYGRASLAQNELGVSSQELLSFTEHVAQALRISGRSAAESSGALLQLSQALGSGVVRAEEFNSILEGALPVAQAAAAGLEEAGGSVAKLRQLVADGKVSSEAFFRAFEAGAATLEEKLAGSQLTVAQGFTMLTNTTIEAAASFDEATGLSEALGGALATLAEEVENVGDFFRDNKQPIGEFFGAIGDGFAAIEKWKTDFRAALGLSGPGGLDDFLDGTSLLKGRIGFRSQQPWDDADSDVSWKQVQDLINEGGDPVRITVTGGKKVSLKDFKSPSGNTASANEYEKAVESIKKRTAALQAETAAQATLNPLINDYGLAVETAKAKQDLLWAAQEAGIKITPELRAAIDTLAAGYAGASVEAQKLAESQDKARANAEMLRDVSKDVFRGFIDDMIAGKSAADILANSLGKIGDKLLEIGLDSLFGGGSNKDNPFGQISSLVGLPKREHGGPVRAGQPYIVGEKRPEVFVPSTSGAILPRVPDARSLASGSGGGAITIDARTTINAPNADAAGLARLEAMIRQRDAELPSRVVGAIRQARASRQI